MRHQEHFIPEVQGCALQLAPGLYVGSIWIDYAVRSATTVPAVPDWLPVLSPLLFCVFSFVVLTVAFNQARAGDGEPQWGSASPLTAEVVDAGSTSRAARREAEERARVTTPSREPMPTEEQFSFCARRVPQDGVRIEGRAHT
jgi:hypothetical protein